MKGESVEVLSARLHRLIEGKTIKSARYEERALFIEFTDGARMFVDGRDDRMIDVSIT